MASRLGSIFYEMEKTRQKNYADIKHEVLEYIGGSYNRNVYGLVAEFIGWMRTSSFVNSEYIYAHGGNAEVYFKHFYLSKNLTCHPAFIYGGFDFFWEQNKDIIFDCFRRFYWDVEVYHQAIYIDSMAKPIATIYEPILSTPIKTSYVYKLKSSFIENEYKYISEYKNESLGLDVLIMKMVKDLRPNISRDLFLDVLSCNFMGIKYEPNLMVFENKEENWIKE